MSTLQIRIDEKLKADVLAVLKELNITPSDACRQFLRYVVENEELPVVMISEDVSDDDILSVAKDRLKSEGKRIRVKIDEI